MLWLILDLIYVGLVIKVCSDIIVSRFNLVWSIVLYFLTIALGLILFGFKDKI